MNASPMLRGIARWCLLPASLAVLAAPGAAQDISQEWAGPANLALELDRPFFAYDDGFTAFTGLGYLSGTFGSGNRRYLFEVPFSRGGIDSGDFSSSSSMIGSPYLGIAWVNPEERRGVSGSLGVRIPVPESFVFGDDDYAVGIGIMGDPDRFEAFLTKTATASGALRYELPLNERVFLRGQIDADVLFFTDAGDGDSVEAFTGWGGLVHWDGDAAFASAGLTGRILLTEDGDDRMWHQLQGRAGMTFGSIQPWIGARVPVQGDFLEDTNWILQLGVQWNLGN